MVYICIVSFACSIRVFQLFHEMGLLKDNEYIR